MSSIPKPHDQRYTVADYLTWSDEERWELIDGVAYDMSPAPTIKHQNVAGEFYVQLSQKLRGKSCQPIIAPVDVVLSERDVVQPDVIVVCDPGKITEKNIRGAPDLVVEVLSPYTATKDLREKKALYERAGVNEYLLIDSLEEYAQAFRLGDDGYFGAGAIYGPNEVLPLQSLENLEVALWEVFGLPQPGSEPPTDRPHP